MSMPRHFHWKAPACLKTNSWEPPSLDLPPSYTLPRRGRPTEQAPANRTVFLLRQQRITAHVTSRAWPRGGWCPGLGILVIRVCKRVNSWLMASHGPFTAASMPPSQPRRLSSIVIIRSRLLVKLQLVCPSSSPLPYPGQA